MTHRPELREQCRGRWPSILPALGLPASLVNGRNQPCPLCSVKPDSDRFRYVLSAADGHVICSQCMPPEDGVDGVAFVQRWLGCSFAEAATRIREVLGEAPVVKPRDDSQRQRARAQRIWREAVPLTVGDPVTRYLRSRGLSGNPERLRSLRYHAAQVYYGDHEPSRHPAMVALIASPDGQGSAVHLTYLADDGSGKARVPTPRKRIGSAPPGSAVRLLSGPPESELIVGEGIESVLSLAALGKRSVSAWAALDAGALERIEVPDRPIVIGADNDPTFIGQRAAFAAAARLVSDARRVRVACPPEGDWNDELVRRHGGAVTQPIENR